MPEPRLITPDRRRRRLLTGLGAIGASTLLSGCGDSLSHNDGVQAVISSTQDLTRYAQRLVASREALAREYSPADIAPSFRANGTTSPQNPQYQKLAGGGFADYRLQVGGEVRQPAAFSLETLRALPARTQITRHDCVEGWSCIGQWQGAVLGDLLDQVQPTDAARYVVFHCADYAFGASQPYYESLDMVEAYHPQTLLAYGLNGQALPVAYGAPLRLRAERQLGYKMAKYVMAIELVKSFDHIQGGKGGYWEDRGYQWWAGI